MWRPEQGFPGGLRKSPRRSLGQRELRWPDSGAESGTAGRGWPGGTWPGRHCPTCQSLEHSGSPGSKPQGHDGHQQGLSWCLCPFPRGHRAVALRPALFKDSTLAGHFWSTPWSCGLLAPQPGPGGPSIHFSPGDKLSPSCRLGQPRARVLPQPVSPCWVSPSTLRVGGIWTPGACPSRGSGGGKELPLLELLTPPPLWLWGGRCVRRWRAGRDQVRPSQGFDGAVQLLRFFMWQQGSP